MITPVFPVPVGYGLRLLEIVRLAGGLRHGSEELEERSAGEGEVAAHPAVVMAIVLAGLFVHDVVFPEIQFFLHRVSLLEKKFCGVLPGQLARA